MTYPVLALLVLLTLCNSPNKGKYGDVSYTKVDPKKVLIVYLSRTGNTKVIAEIIHKLVGGKMVELELETPYPENYKTTVEQVVRENETGYLPPLKTKIENKKKN